VREQTTERNYLPIAEENKIRQGTSYSKRTVVAFYEELKNLSLYE